MRTEMRVSGSDSYASLFLFVNGVPAMRSHVAHMQGPGLKVASNGRHSKAGYQSSAALLWYADFIHTLFRPGLDDIHSL